MTGAGFLPLQPRRGQPAAAGAEASLRSFAAPLASVESPESFARFQCLRRASSPPTAPAVEATEARC